MGASLGAPTRGSFESGTISVVAAVYEIETGRVELFQ